MTVSRVLADRRTPLSEVLARVVDEIPRGWQRPDLAKVRLRVHDAQWVAAGFVETAWMMTQPIPGGGSAGAIDVAYAERPDLEPVFLAEETQLLQAIAERIADVLELEVAQGALAKYRDELRSLASQLTIAEERERRELAMHLHDRIGQDLALLKLRVESLRGRAREDSDNRTVDQVCELAAGVLAQTRTLMFEISPPILHELGLVPALEWLADSVRAQHGLSVDVDADSVTIAEDDLKALLFRSTRELLSNVVRHAGARTAVIRVRVTQSSIRIEVEDDGRGYEQPRVVASNAGFGLFSIRERLAHLGGRLELFSTIGRGTRAVVEAPLTRENRP